jgi:hypothetical protein
MTTEHEPGMKLDALVAEKVMGWSFQPGSHLSAGLDHNGNWKSTPSYSSDISAAWEVVKRLTFMRDKGVYKPVIRLEFFEHDGPYEFRIGRCKSIDQEDDIVVRTDERCGTERWPDELTVTTCMSICLAALKAVGAE